MTDDLALLAAIRAAPADDAPRLVYADWLDDHGQPERAEFIRVQCELARRDDPALRRREVELLAEYRDTFARPLGAPGLQFRFHRGFLRWFDHTGVFVGERKQGTGSLVHSTWAEMFRFYTGGRAQRAISDISPEVDAHMRFAGHRPCKDFEYFIDPFLSPPQICFTLGSSDRPIDCRGYLKGSRLIVDRYDPTDRTRTRRRYVLEPIGGFDSFPET